MERPQTTIHAFGDFELDESRFELRRDGARVPLEPKPLRLLLYLVENRERVIPRDELFDHVWPDVIVGESAVSTALREVRRALGDEGRTPHLVETLRGRGYRFIAPVEERDTDAVDAHSDDSEPTSVSPDADTGRASPQPMPGRRVAAAAGAVALLIGAWWVWSQGPSSGETPSPPIRSVAVLPFIDLSPGGDHEYLADGFAEEIINALAHVEGLRVVARTSSFAFKGEDGDIREIGRQLDVGAVVEGSIRKAGNHLRITAQLVRVEDGFHIWSQAYDRELTDVFAVQSEIASAAVDAADLHLKMDASRRPMGSFLAYELYLEGRYFLNQGWAPGRGLAGAIASFERALEEDPDLAVAHVGLADAYTTEVTFSFVDTGRALSEQVASNADRLARAERALTRAIAIDDARGEAHASLGFLRMQQFRWRDAEREFERALQQSPGYARAHSGYGTLLAATGRVEAALAEFRRAVELDPLSSGVHATAGLHYALLTTDYDAAIERSRRALELNPKHFWATTFVGRALFEKGLESQAVDTAVTFPFMPEFVRAELRAVAEVSGYRGLLKGLHEFGASDSRPRLPLDPGRLWFSLCNPVNIPQMALIGETDLLFRCLREYVDLRGATGLVADPWYDDYREDPRFQAILSKAGLDEYASARLTTGQQLAGLAAKTSRLLEAASGLPAGFSLDVASRAASLAGESARGAIDEALEAQLLHPVGGAGSYAFERASVRYRVYEALEPAQQASLHRRIAEALEDVYGEDTGEHAAEVARHYHRSASLPGAERGLAHCVRAADAAERAEDHEEAAAFLRMALELLPKNDSRRADVLARLELSSARTD